jgi:tight adherence protein C
VAGTPLLSMFVFLAVFAGISSVGVLAYRRLTGDRRRALARLRTLSADDPAPADKQSLGELARTTLPKIGAVLLPKRKEAAAHLQRRLLQAGFYNPHALRFFLGMKLLLMMVFPCLAGLLPYGLGVVSLQRAVLLVVSASSVGMLVPGLWLDHQVKKRQRLLRNGLPDALDMLVLCLEGGVSLIAAFQRVTAELQIVHPELGREMNIIQREIQFGLSTGEALRKMGERCGLDDVRDLASVLLQSERFGASVVKALRLHADTWRQERQHRAEEMAQKASVKILFPTLLCIFPAIFIVLLGPAALQMAGLFSK